ncbi:GNAT family N-acetyltransferase [Streptomyces sp. SID11385]|nr:GNAT family N-acetyltransferase [Streptomyces sp. SID11385]
MRAMTPEERTPREPLAPPPPDPAIDFWTGERVRLRAVEPEDWPHFMRYGQHSAHVRLGDRLTVPRSAERYRTWLKERTAKEEENDTFHLVVEDRETGAWAGGISTHHVELGQGNFAYGIEIDPRFQGRGFAREAVTLVLRFMFEERRYHKAVAEAWAHNTASVALQRGLGFVQEARLREHDYTEGAYRDVLLFGLLKDEFRSMDAGNKD